MPRKARVDEWSRWGKDDIDGKPGGRVSGRRTSQIVASAAGGPWRHHHYDGQGNCIFLTDGWGTILEQYDYDAFGRPYFYNAGGDSIGYSPNNNRFLFTGREWLKDLKVYDYRNRMYQPELGRFLQPDPKQFGAGDYNLYRYCHNDPVNMMDPSGTDPVAAAAIIAGGLTLAGEEEAFGVLTPPAHIAAALTISGALIYAGVKYFQDAESPSEKKNDPVASPTDKPKPVDKPPNGKEATQDSEGVPEHTEPTGTTQLEGVEAAQDAAKENRPSIQKGEWEGVKSRPKQNAIRSIQKSKQRAKAEDYDDE